MYTVIHAAQHITTFFWDDVVNSRLRVYSHATSAVRLNSGTAMLELNTNSGMATEGKVSGSPKWLEFILRGAWMSGPNFHPIVLFFLFQSGPKRWTRLPTNIWQRYSRHRPRMVNGYEHHSHHSNAVPQDAPNTEVISRKHWCRQAGPKITHKH